MVKRERQTVTLKNCDSYSLKRASFKQIYPFQFKNPLIARFGKIFFSAIPKSSGVYFMKSKEGELLYIGKSKNLQNRLRSYTYANKQNTSRKVLKLIHLVNSIEWEVLPNEKFALLRENQLLRAHHPIFNVLNTVPHTYLFVHLRLENSGIRFLLATAQNEKYPDIYGAFKNIGIVVRAEKALLRILWAIFYVGKNRFEFPSILTSRKKIDQFFFKFPTFVDKASRIQLYRDLKRFYNGTSKQLLSVLVDKLLTREELSPFMRLLLQEDIDLALIFYNCCANKNRRIKKILKIKTEIIPQDQIDDLIVLLNCHLKDSLSV